MKKIGFIGLGRMGNSMVLNLLSKKYSIVAYNRSPEPTKKIAKQGAIATFDLKDLAHKLQKPKVVWLMIASGKPVDDTIKSLLPHLSKGDIIIDGGNSMFLDSQRRYKMLKSKEIQFLDCGTSGGVEGARNGASMMVGGDKSAFKKTENLFKDMCVKNGYGYMGESGAGHFVKMVHNGIEYGMMGSIAEGFGALEKHKNKFNLNIKEAAKVYSNGAIISGRLMSWLWDAFEKPGYIQKIPCKVPKGETEDEIKWLARAADIPVIDKSRLERVRTRKQKNFCGKLISALRNQFGQHDFFKKA